MPFSVFQDSDQRTFRLVGELDLASADQLIQELESAVRDDGDLRLDVEGLEFMDSAGITALVRVCQDLGDRGRVVLRAPSDEVAKVLQLIGADQLPNLLIDDDGGSAGTIASMLVTVSPPAQSNPTAGGMAHYVLASGDHRPGVIVGVQEKEVCNLAILLDPTDQDTDLPALCRREGASEARARMVSHDEGARPGTWHYPEG
jgi:anti-anti-sigma factor